MKKRTGFEKFFTEKKGSAKKEEMRQEKRKWKKALTEKAEKRRQETQQKETAPARPTIKKAAVEQMPLNKYIAHSGVCSRRDAVELIKAGKVSVNGAVITEPGHKILAT